MPPSHDRPAQRFQATINQIKPGLPFVIMIFGALIAFEAFNYSTTDHALSDVLGPLAFAGVPWSTILALAFCGIDFAGIARLFTPEQGANEPKEVWYLFGAWLLAATMNAILTWWGVSMAVSSHVIQSKTVVDPQTITTIVPIFVAIMVWVIRILIIGTLSLSMDRLLHPEAVQHKRVDHHISASAELLGHPAAQYSHSMNVPASLNSAAIPARPSMARAAQSSNARSAARFSGVVDEPTYVSEVPVRNSRPEPTYHSLSMSARSQPGAAKTIGTGERAGGNSFRRS